MKGSLGFDENLEAVVKVGNGLFAADTYFDVCFDVLFAATFDTFKLTCETFGVIVFEIVSDDFGIVEVFGPIDEFFDIVDRVFGAVNEVFGIINWVFGIIDGVFGTVVGVFGTVDGVFGTIDEVFGTVDGVFGTVNEVFDTVDAVFSIDTVLSSTVSTGINPTEGLLDLIKERTRLELTEACLNFFT